jgi:hypothetical protein
MEEERCVKSLSSPNIFEVRGKQRVLFKTWKDYVAAGQPPYEIITDAEMSDLELVDGFTEPEPEPAPEVVERFTASKKRRRRKTEL